MSLRAVNVTFAYPQQHSLITSCTFDLHAGWTGVVGRNGAGKSTLLDLIAGDLRPTSGQIDRDGLTVARCHQLGDELPDEVVEFANAWTNESMRWMSLLELPPEDVWRWDELSPGMRRRWQIAAALAASPGILLLDEPTNHLDSAGREVMLGALRRFDGIGVVVSHDRQLLNRLTAVTLRIHNNSVVRYDGPYEVASPLWRAEAAASLAILESQQAEVRRLKSQLTTASHRQSTSAASLSTKARLTSVRDNDARSSAAKGRAQRAEAGASRRKSIARADLQRALASLDNIQRPEADGGQIFIDAEPMRREYALQFRGDVVVGTRTLASNVTFDLRRGERRHLCGPNGCGKSTLLRAILESTDLPTDRVVAVPQVLDADAALDAFTALAPEDHTRTLQIGAALGLEARNVVDGGPLSPGETRKLTVSLGLANQPWLIVLDEPTNDLDLDAVERLENALADYCGALIVVTHDDAFALNLRAYPWRFPSETF